MKFKILIENVSNFAKCFKKINFRTTYEKVPTTYFDLISCTRLMFTQISATLK